MPMKTLLPPSRTAMPASPRESIAVASPAEVVDRFEFLTELVRGRYVIDLGFVDLGRTESKMAANQWLHGRLSEAAARLVGVDSDPQGVELARSRGFDVRCADCHDGAEVSELGLEPAELVVASELIEHLDRPGDFLDSIRPLLDDRGTLVLTTPNPHALTNSLMALIHREVQNADHVGWHSWRTISTLLERHRWRVERILFYVHPRFYPNAHAPRHERLRVHAFNAYQTAIWPLLRFSPSLADGLIVCASKEPE
jgi:SAM-dependent methyltransferase